MAQATFERDTLTAYADVIETGRIMGGMTLMAVPEQDRDHEEPHRLTVVHYLPDPTTPTPEEVAAKKARRRLDGMEQGVDRHGVSRPHFFNAAGYDVWGYDARGNYNQDEDTHPSIPNPFAH